ncbi:hypothetical protein DT87_02955 [Streptomyces sp. NTK 937]|nr:hypothetical protein DT87_02955 [Streptomyces sp. NTK 937]
MSTEAQRAPVPPRPASPPPTPAQAPATRPDAPQRATSSGTTARPDPASRPETPQRPAPASSGTATDRPTPTASRPAAPRQPPPTPSETTARLRPVPPPTSSETTTQLRAVPPAPPAPQASAGPAHPGPPPPPHTPAGHAPTGATRFTPYPGRPPAPPHLSYGYAHAETPSETTTRLRVVRPRHRARTATAAVCAVLGLGLVGGAVTGTWLTRDSAADPAAHNAYTVGRSAWRDVPVDTLFPRTLKGDGAGPGATDRVWTRVAVAADSDCAAGLDPLLLTTLRPVGCERLVRATYTDATRSSVTTVGLLFTEAGAEAMSALDTRFTTQHLGRRTDLMPRTYPAKGTPAAGFGDAQRASWTVHVLTEVPVVVLSVSGFADGRTVTDPQPAAAAMKSGATTPVAEAGLGHEAKGIADRVERTLRRTITDLTEKPE